MNLAFTAFPPRSVDQARCNSALRVRPNPSSPRQTSASDPGSGTGVTAERVRRVNNGYDYKGTQKEDLYRETITWTNFSKEGAHHKLLQHVHSIENLDGLRFDSIKKEIKDETKEKIVKNVSLAVSLIILGSILLPFIIKYV